MGDGEIAGVLTSRPLHVLAVGKAAAAMAVAFSELSHLSVRRILAIGTHAPADLPATIEWLESSHPFPDSRSENAGNRALAMAQDVHSGEALVILLSGGASALMAAPIDGITLRDKIETTRRMMSAGADIHALNTVRRHLSKVKGGRLAAACVGATVTLAISDVVGDDLHAIGSGPGVPDQSTWADARAALLRFGGESHAASVMAVVQRGIDGTIADTPKPGGHATARAVARVIGSRADAMAGARQAAIDRGYQVDVVDDPITGEARIAGPEWLTRVQRVAAGRRRACVISSGETTVTVTGSGSGGRNLEFALSIAEAMAGWPAAAMASVGTDGIDGSSGVAGAIVDATTMARARQAGLELPGSFLAANNSFAFFAPLGDVVRLGRTDTNVGDLQVLVID